MLYFIAKYRHILVQRDISHGKLRPADFISLGALYRPILITKVAFSLLTDRITPSMAISNAVYGG